MSQISMLALSDAAQPDPVSLPANTRQPSGEKATEFTGPDLARKVRISVPVAKSQSFSVVSLLPDST